MLTLVGAGLGSIDDLTLKGEKALKECDFVYLDMYTSVMKDCATHLERISGKVVKLADRELLEESGEIIENAIDHNVVLVVVGDPLGATTHTDIILKAVKRDVPFRIIHNTSILTAVGCCGLMLYNFGATVSIPFWDDFGAPRSFYDKIEWNFSRGLHTLCLLDIKVKERSLENILRERKIYEPPRFMSCEQAACQLMQIIEERKDTESPPKLSPDCLVVGLARIGSEDQAIVVCRLREMSLDCSAATSGGDSQVSSPISTALGGPLHSLVIPGLLHPSEQDFLSARIQLKPSTSNGLPQVFFPYAKDEASDNQSDALTRLHSLFDAHRLIVEAASVKK
ncbi:unnamed protein product [Calicophoron daubneyi]|uniref:diphthine methyl ester synthase n=1 Tax=Calicophoron daubneyi TaxID=300641 RepID=A0AAV2TT90_CALDB